MAREPKKAVVGLLRGRTDTLVALGLGRNDFELISFMKERLNIVNKIGFLSGGGEGKEVWSAFEVLEMA